jgi:hypothetical protein
VLAVAALIVLAAAGASIAVLTGQSGGASSTRHLNGKTTYPASSSLTRGLAANEARVRSVVVSFLQATAQGNGAAACALMTRGAQQKTARDARRVGAGSSCADGMAEVTRRVKASGEISAVEASSVTAEEVSGDRATATIEAAGRAGPAYLLRVNGRWLVDTGAPDASAG